MTGTTGYVGATVRLSPDGGVEWATVRAHLPPGVRAADVATVVGMLKSLVVRQSIGNTARATAGSAIARRAGRRVGTGG